MNESHDNPLDQLLQDWAQSNAVGMHDLASLQRRIQDRIMTEQRLSPAPTPQAADPIEDGRRFPAALVGIAAALFIAIFGWWYVRPMNGDGEIAQIAPPLADQAHLLTEYQVVFGPELCWLVEQPGRSEIGLRPAGSNSSAAPRDFVAVRLRLVARPTSDKEWKEIQSLDVVTRREEVVEVAAEPDHPPALTLWAYPLDEKMISIDLRYEPSAFAAQSSLPPDVALESSSVQSFDESAQVMSFESGGVEYRLFQRAVLLTDRGVG